MGLDRTSGRTADARHDADGGAGSRAAVRLAWATSALAISSGALFLTILALNSRNPDVPTYEYWGAQAVTAVVFPVVGALIVSRRPRNALGWLFCLIGLSSGLSGVALEYAAYALAAEPTLPGAATAAWLDTWVGILGFVSLALIPLLFPDGRPPSRRWLPLVWISAGAIVLGTVSFALMPGPLDGYPSIDNPLGVEGTKGVFEFLLIAGALVIGATLFAGIASLFVRYRRSRGVERQQLKWFAFAAAMTPLALLGNTLFPDFAWFIGGVGVACIPTAIGVAILKYRLYDIDIIVNRTLVYGGLTACVVGIYVLVVGYLGAMFRTGGNLAISLVATGIVAVLFAPLRDRLQRAANRLMYGERDDPYKVLSRLGESLENALAPEAALATVAESVAQALKLPHAAVVLKQEGRFVTAAQFGTPVGESVVLPLTHHAEEVGRMVVSPRSPGEEFSPADRRLLGDLARQAGSAAHAARLTADLKRSRERLVAAREEERRRLRRDLHDGIGPRLATLALKHDAAMNLLSHDPEAVGALLAELKAETQEAIADVRRVVHDLRPPALDQLGLARALEEWTHRSTGGTRVSLDAPDNVPPLPAAVEVAAFRIIQEALTNVVRHAEARKCTVRLALDGTALLVEVSDDGCGIGEVRKSGVGLSSMRERAEELGGSFGVEALSEGGTRVRAGLPLRLESPEASEENAPREGITPPVELRETAP